MFFVPTLLMFSLNFKLISNSNILPYITAKDLNWKVKKACTYFRFNLAISFIISIVCLVAALTKCDSSVVIFLYLSTWPLNILYEKFVKKQEVKYHLILPFIVK